MVIRLLTNEPLPRPQWLREENWLAISHFHERLISAVERDDRPGIVGSAKELVESVARVVLTAHGRTVSDGDDYLKVLGAAHKVIEHATSPDVPANHPVRSVPEGTRKIAGYLRELRNDFGSGHGRAIVHDVTDEVVDTCIQAALLWVRWALARLQTVLLGAVNPLVEDLRSGALFYKGDLETRLAVANIPQLDPAQQRLLGIAVGQRTANQTNNVRIEGVRACARQPERWPDEYRAGVIEGLFLNEDGQVHTYPAAGPECAAELLQHHSAPNNVLEALRELLITASWSIEFQHEHQDAITAMKAALHQVPTDAKPLWRSVISTLEDRTPSEYNPK
ncbi:hypothetical protein ACODT3_04930 [Streptomyces sp. 4.24]|uniref:hypothetical protein n=1 Tax=Streptomyces tritrimontium TaxID=3406573 RepID=UPI003BB5AA9A